MRGGSSHDRVIDQQHILAPKLDAHRIELLTNRPTADGLARHDEGAPDITILDEALAIIEVEAIGQLQC